MKVSILGCGNAGSALALHLANHELIDELLLLDTSHEYATAAMLDALSAVPGAASQLRAGSSLPISDSDIVVLAAGYQIPRDRTARDVAAKNRQIATALLEHANLENSAVLIAVSSPVDEITAHIQRTTGLPKPQVIGFGGDLDRNRLIVSLTRREMPTRDVSVIGEHGASAIPVYRPTQDYEDIASEVRHFLAQISEAGAPRNLATGVLLAGLVDTIVRDSGRVHHVCAWHSQFGDWLTWPYCVGRSGILRPQSLTLPKQAKKDLDALRSQRRHDNCSE